MNERRNRWDTFLCSVAFLFPPWNLSHRQARWLYQRFEYMQRRQHQVRYSVAPQKLSGATDSLVCAQRCGLPSNSAPAGEYFKLWNGTVSCFLLALYCPVFFGLCGWRSSTLFRSSMTRGLLKSIRMGSRFLHLVLFWMFGLIMSLEAFFGCMDWKRRFVPFLYF